MCQSDAKDSSRPPRHTSAVPTVYESVNARKAVGRERSRREHPLVDRAGPHKAEARHEAEALWMGGGKNLLGGSFWRKRRATSELTADFVK